LLENLVRTNLRYAPTGNEGVETLKNGAEHSMIGKGDWWRNILA